MSEQIKAGTRVEWRSTSNGCTRAKSGVVVEVVSAGAYPSMCWTAGVIKYGPLRNGLPITNRRDHVSYVVEVVSGARSKPRYYWPRAAALRVVAEPVPMWDVHKCNGVPTHRCPACWAEAYDVDAEKRAANLRALGYPEVRNA